MIKQALLGEFLHEAENTRKILQAIPDSALDWKPSEKTGQPVSLPLTLLKYTIGTNPLSIRIFLIWVHISMTKEIFPKRRISLQNSKKMLPTHRKLLRKLG